MLSSLCNSCRGFLSHKIKTSHVNLRKFVSQATAVEIPVPERPPAPKEKTLIIKCKHQELNFYSGQTYDKFKGVPLASKGWRHPKSVGDYFVLYPDAIAEEAPSEREINTFEESPLNRQLVHNLKENELYKPSEIQSIAIPVLMTGKNSIIAAETGCGKTLAYLLPLLEQIVKWKKLFKREANEPLGVILSPSRDLTQQLGYVAKRMAKDMDIKVRVIVGGRTKQQMMNPTIDDVDLLIGSFGAISKLTTTGIYKMSGVRHVVLEEADTLLDDSFTDKLRLFLRKIKFSFTGPPAGTDVPSSAQLTLVSATMPTYLPEALDEIVNTDSLVRLTTDKLHRILPQVAQRFMRLSRSSRPGEILKIAKANAAKKHQTIVFCNTIKNCEWLFLFLSEMGISCCCTHGSVPANVRSTKFAEFQRGEFSLLATTDACSRGLDTVQVKHVVNFDFPLYTSDYIHRCGRTGRLGSREKCVVTNFITSEREVELVQKIEQAVRTSEPLPSVNGNITKVINNKIQREINRTQSLLNKSPDAPEYLKR